MATPALSSLLLNYEPITSSSSLCLIAKYHHYDSSWGKKELHHIAIKYGGGGRIEMIILYGSKQITLFLVVNDVP